MIAMILTVSATSVCPELADGTYNQYFSSLLLESNFSITSIVGHEIDTNGSHYFGINVNSKSMIVKIN